MILAIIIVIIAFSFLMVIHELGHFLLARKFKVKVEEFGVGIPPRLFGKKFGETFYSFNLIPFGAFIKVYGEDGSTDKNDSYSFSNKPAWQRALILLGGVVSFWLVSAILFSIVFSCGVTMVVGDKDDPRFLDPKVQVLGIIPDSPAEISDLKIGDVILKLKYEDKILETDKEAEVRSFIAKYPETPVFFTIQRGRDFLEKTILLSKTPEGDGLLGIYLQRTAIVKYSWFLAPVEGVKATINTTKLAFWGYLDVFENLFKKGTLPPGVEIMGPVGVGAFMTGAFQISFIYFLQILATISIFLAIINLLPIPALDGGRLLFLGIEKIRNKPFSPKTEGSINGAFFLLLMVLMVFITVKDIIRLF